MFILEEILDLLFFIANNFDFYDFSLFSMQWAVF